MTGDAYDLIMKNKELLLDRDPKKSPVRFIFSHSALREGWDNPQRVPDLHPEAEQQRGPQAPGGGPGACACASTRTASAWTPMCWETTSTTSMC